MLQEELSENRLCVHVLSVLRGEEHEMSAPFKITVQAIFTMMYCSHCSTSVVPVCVMNKSTIQAHGYNIVSELLISKDLVAQVSINRRVK